MNSIREIQRLNKAELEQGIPPSASWHVDYRDTAYVHVGGLPFDLTEGDILTIFSQFGEPTFVKLQRDKTTGKSRGLGWVKYEDQRSCDLAVDNLGGATVLGRVLKVDHTRYKKRDDESEEEDAGAGARAGAEKGARAASVESEEERPRRPLLKEEIELQKLLVEHDAEDPMKQFLIDEKKAEVEQALERQRREGVKGGKHERREKRSNGHRERSQERTRDRRRRNGSADSYEREWSRRHRDRRSGDSPRRDRTTDRDRGVRDKEEGENDYRRRRRADNQDRDHTPVSSRRHRDYSPDTRARDHTPVIKDRRKDRSHEDDYSRRKQRRRSRSRSP